jgi:hypothetical protein
MTPPAFCNHREMQLWQLIPTVIGIARVAHHDIAGRAQIDLNGFRFWNNL